MGPITLHRVTCPTQKLQVVEVVRAALTLWHHVVHREVAERECHSTPSAPTFLLAEQLMLVRSVAREFAQVCALWHVVSVVNVVEQPERFLEARLDQLGRQC